MVAERTLVAAATFRLDPGDRVAVIGPNGMGKTTLFRTLAGTLAAESGRIENSEDFTVAVLDQLHRLPAGTVYALSFFLTGISSLMVGKLSERVGLIRSIVLPRLLGVVLLIAIPFMPAFGYAAVLYVARSIVNRGSVGARQAFSVGLVRDHRRGLASSLNAVSWSLPAALGPAIGGWLIGTGSLTLPFALAAGLQLSYAILFPTLMSQYEPDRKSPAVAVSNRGGQGSG